TGNLLINASCSYTCSTSPIINISGDWTNNGTFTPASSTVTFNNTSIAQTISGTSAAQAFNNIIISKAGQSLNVSGTAGTNLNITGNWTNNGGTFVPAAGRVTFNGGTTQQINGPTATTFNNVTINSTGVSLNGIDANITGGASALTFTAGKITTGANMLILGNAATISGAGAGKYIYGNLQMGIVSGATTRTFEIGDATNYTPVTLALSGVSNSTGSITAFTIGSQHPNIATALIDETQDINRYYSLTNIGVTLTSYNPTFTFISPGDIVGVANSANYIVGLYNGAWAYPAVGTKTTTSTQATGVSSFGTFAIGSPGSVPTINTQPSNQSGCVSTTASFTAKANNNPASAAVWQISIDGGGSFNNLTIAAPYSVVTTSASGVTTSVLTVNPLTAGLNNYQYRVIFTNTKGTLTTNAAILTVAAPPTAAAAGSDQAKCNNGNYTLAGNTVTVGTGAWSVVGGTATITTPSSSTSTVTGVPLGTSATLRWTISNSPCTASTDDVILT